VARAFGVGVDERVTRLLIQQSVAPSAPLEWEGIGMAKSVPADGLIGDAFAGTLPGRFTFATIACRALSLAAMLFATLLLASCSSTEVSKNGRVKDPKYGVYTSPRGVAGTDRIDPAISRRGVYMVGKPYTVAGRQYVPREDRRYSAIGMASWYGNEFHGRLTANGEVFDMHDISAAHPTMPIPSYARVTNVANGNSIVVRVNDRGPFHGSRVIDVSRRAAELLAFKSAGTGRVRVDYLGPAQQTGSDEGMLLATLRTDGSPAPAPIGDPGRVMIAQAGSGSMAPPGTPAEDDASQPAGVPSSAAAFSAAPPAQPAEIETIPAAVSPLPQPEEPKVIPLPPERTADSATGALTVVDIVGRSGKRRLPRYEAAGG
jgi:rare lipoprotein A